MSGRICENVMMSILSLANGENEGHTMLTDTVRRSVTRFPEETGYSLTTFHASVDELREHPQYKIGEYRILPID